MEPPRQVDIRQPQSTLRWFDEGERPLALNRIDVAQPWGLVGITALARRVPIDIVDAQPAVRSGLELLESYGLGG